MILTVTLLESIAQWMARFVVLSCPLGAHGTDGVGGTANPGRCPGLVHCTPWVCLCHRDELSAGTMDKRLSIRQFCGAKACHCEPPCHAGIAAQSSSKARPVRWSFMTESNRPREAIAPKKIPDGPKVARPSKSHWASMVTTTPLKTGVLLSGSSFLGTRTLASG